MSDILTVLDEQTTQTQALILRLNERLTQTRQLQTLEVDRRATEARVGNLEGRLQTIEADLVHLRQQAALFDPNRFLTAAAHLDKVWPGESGVGASLLQTTPAVRPVEAVVTLAPVEAVADPAPVEAVADPAPVEAVAEVEFAFDTADNSPAEVDAADVLGSFLGGSGDWGGHSNFFSAAEELGSADADLDDWWQETPSQTPAAAAPFGEMDAFGFDLPLPGSAPELPEFAPETSRTPAAPTGRKGLLGRFF